MRFVVYGAGAIGGVVGGRLFEGGHEVVLIARGPHYEAIRTRGLRLESPDDETTLAISAVDAPGALRWRPDDVVLLATKTQDTAPAVRALRATGIAPDTPIVCVQNGVDNERQALRLFARVYGVCVMCPATFLHPGVVQASSTPVTGILDIGAYPRGADATAHAVATALAASTFVCEVRADIMRWKYAKLLMNLGNAVEAVCGPAARGRGIGRMAKDEGTACLRAAGIAFASDDEDEARRGDLLHVRPIDDRPRAGSSSWQSLERATGTIETAYLNGEIVLLGRLHGVPTPVNELLTVVANDMARHRNPPGTLDVEELLARLKDVADG